MEKRYQVFISSTYEDLKEERHEVMQALLELDCIPSGMELFPAANEDQWSLIKSVINDCDYYIVIIAGRYGHCDAAGTSYTEKEYRYAAELGKPIIAFLHGTPGDIIADKCEPTEEGRRKLEAFRSLVEQKHCKYWETAEGLGGVVSRGLINLTKSTPATGWVRADELPTQEAALELLKLRNHVDELEAELAHTRVTAPEGIEDLSQGDETTLVNFSFMDFDDKTGNSDRDGTFVTTWNLLFSAIAPTMIDEASEETLRGNLNWFVAQANREQLQRRGDLAGHLLEIFKLRSNDFQTVKVQLRALGLIVKSAKPHGIKDTDTYWTLTPYGDETMTRLRAIKRTPAATQAPKP